MSLAAHFDDDDDDAPQVATTKGWVDLINHAYHIDEDKYPELVHMIFYGWSQDLPALKSQLQSILETHLPSADVEDTLSGILDMVSGRTNSEVLVISDGVS